MILTILAQTSTEKTTNPLVSLLPIILLVVVFYMFMIRPQRNRMRQHQELLQAIDVGDEVETIGGIYGTIRGKDEDAFLVEISPGTTVRLSRGAVRRKVWQEEDQESPGSST